MRSPTQRNLDFSTIEALLSKAFAVDVRSAAELSGGGFAAVWRAGLADGREVVVKVGPPPGAGLLRYERGLIAAEAAYFRIVRAGAPGVPVPEVLHLGDDWIVTTLLPGESLTGRPEGAGPADDAAVREQLGAAIAGLHRITGPHFGYTGDRPAGADWPAAYGAIIAALLADAADWAVPLPPGIGALATRHHAALATATRPALLHFDLWDGNVLAAGDRLTGLVDGERFLWGDPLLDLVSPALFRRIEDEPEHPFLRGYTAATGLVLDDTARIRLALCRVHLYVLMLAEGPSRGIPVGGDRHDRLTGLLAAELRDLK
ncbi:aminoglycoside phosphotransferase family protein [Amorphoplanes nipponensis]|uniref:Phosphotransferase n=1 Tax=Actinoplanes nipponensis TaxID=135950 RepID=A0A919JEH8_9ACTN|nr:phosphotransferase [Actinoplanes nipponensis]GIE47865.1 phosphotransferase [Actinoplanes nipponensis]